MSVPWSVLAYQVEPGDRFVVEHVDGFAPVVETVVSVEPRTDDVGRVLVAICWDGGEFVTGCDTTVFVQVARNGETVR